MRLSWFAKSVKNIDGNWWDTGHFIIELAQLSDPDFMLATVTRKKTNEVTEAVVFVQRIRLRHFDSILKLIPISTAANWPLYDG